MNQLEIKAACFQKDGNFLWFCPEGLAILCKYDLESEKIVSMQAMPCADGYRVMVKYNKKLVFVPNQMKIVCVYDIEKDVFARVNLVNSDKEYRRYPQFMQGYRKGHYVFGAPEKYPYVVRINMKNLDIAQSENLIQSCRQYSGRLKSMIDFTASAYDGNNLLYLAFDSYYIDQNGNYNGDSAFGICRVSLNTFQVKIRMLNDVKSAIKGMVCYQNRLFSYSGEGRITILNPNISKVDLIINDALHDYKNPWDLYVDYAFAYQERIFFVRKRGLKTLILDLKNASTISKCALIDEWIRHAEIVENGILLQPITAGYFYVIERENCKKNFFQVEDSVLYASLQKMVAGCEQVLRENAILKLSEWVHSVSIEGRCILNEKNAGVTIYDYIITN